MEREKSGDEWFLKMMKRVELAGIQRSYIPECETPEDVRAVERAARRYSKDADRILQGWIGTVTRPFPARPD